MNIIQSITEYLRSSKSELEKISWPSRQDTIRYSALVMGVSIVVAAFFASLDYGLGNVVDAAIQKQQSLQQQQQPATPNTTTVPDTTSSVPGLDIGNVQVQTAPTTAPSPKK